MVNGKTFTKALRDEAGNAISNKREAEQAKDKWMAQFRLADESEAIRAMSDMATGAERKAAEVRTGPEPGTGILSAWRDFVGSPNRPDTGPSTLEQYASQWMAFERWLTVEHQSITALAQITPDIA